MGQAHSSQQARHGTYVAADGADLPGVGEVRGVRARALRLPKELEDGDVEGGEVLEHLHRDGRGRGDAHLGVVQPQVRLHLGQDQRVRAAEAHGGAAAVFVRKVGRVGWFDG